MYQEIEGGGPIDVDPFFELAEAIRAGCRETEPGRQLVVDAPRSRPRTCALGAAYWSRGVRSHRVMAAAKTLDLFPVLRVRVPLPEDEDYWDELAEMIIGRA